MNKRQCKMARAGLGWSAKDLANASGVGSATIARFELGQNISDANKNKLRIAFARQGVGFIDRGQYKYGVYIGEIED